MLMYYYNILIDELISITEKVKRETDATVRAKEPEIFPLTIGIQHLFGEEYPCIVIQRYENLQEWDENNLMKYAWPFVLRMSKKPGKWDVEAFHVMPSVLDANKRMIMNVPLLVMQDFWEMKRQGMDRMTAIMQCLSSLYWDGMKEHDGHLYVPAEKGFLKGKTDKMLNGGCFNKEIRYATMKPGKDASREICLEMEKLSRQYAKKYGNDNSGTMPGMTFGI